MLGLQALAPQLFVDSLATLLAYLFLMFFSFQGVSYIVQTTLFW